MNFYVISKFSKNSGIISSLMIRIWSTKSSYCIKLIRVSSLIIELLREVLS